MPTTTHTSISWYGFSYNNMPAIPLTSFSGLLTSSELISETVDFIRKNKIQSLETHEVVMTIPFPPNNQTLDLFDGIMKGRLTNIFVTIFGITTDGKVSQSYELGNCDVVSVAFPSLDGASKDTGLTTLTLKPKYIDVTLGNNFDTSVVRTTSHEKPFQIANFRLTLDNVQTIRVAAISQLTVCPHSSKSGENRTLEFVEFKSIQIAFGESTLSDQQWLKWLNDFAKNKQTDPRNGKINYMDNDMKTSLLEVTLNNVFIVSTLFHDTSKSTDGRVIVELMFESAFISSLSATKNISFIRSGLEING